MANYMEPEALSFQPSGDFKVRSFGRTGPMDGPIREIDDGPDYLRPRRVDLSPKKPATTPLGSGGPTSVQPPAPVSPVMQALQVDTPTLDSLSLRSQPGRTMFGSMFGSDVVRSFSEGTARVPGQGSGHVDTVPAMLAPGEAVLNRAAAENFGRGNIAQLNAAGSQQMGRGMHGSDEMNDFLRSQGIGVRPEAELRPADASYTQPPRTRSPMNNLASPMGQSARDPSYVRPPSGLARPMGQEMRSNNAFDTMPPGQAGWANGYNAGGVSQPAGPNMGALYGAMDATPAPMVAPRIDRGPAVGMPEDPFNTAWGARPDPVAPPPAQPGWADNFQPSAPMPPSAPNYQRLAYEPPPASMIGGNAAAGAMGPVGWAAPGGGRNGGVDPGMMQSQGLGMRPGPSPSIGGERARGQSFGDAFAAARKKAGGAGGTFQWEGKPGTTFSTRMRGER